MYGNLSCGQSRGLPKVLSLYAATFTSSGNLLMASESVVLQVEIRPMFSSYLISFLLVQTSEQRCVSAVLLEKHIEMGRKSSGKTYISSGLAQISAIS